MLDGAAPQDSLKDVGRTWPDVVHEHAQAGFVLSLVASLLVMLLVGTVFVVIAYRRAGREGRSFDAFGGWLFKLGAPAPPTDGDAAARPVGSGSTSTERPSSEVRPGDDPASPAARGALAIVRAALEIATAASDTVANDREGYLLTALFNSTTHHEGTTRRASILTIVDEPDGDRTMTVHQGFPERSFRRPYARFSSRAFDRDGAGLCWAAVHACRGGHAGDSIKRNVFHAPDVSKETSFVATPGHHAFKSLLVAPILVDGQLLGAICLDSEQTDHYEADDQHLIATAALALAGAWHARGGAAIPRP
ncbi:MAG: GAF domain-containing protein [Polyangiaceae bacterium]